MFTALLSAIFLFFILYGQFSAWVITLIAVLGGCTLLFLLQKAKKYPLRMTSIDYHTQASPMQYHNTLLKMLAAIFTILCCAFSTSMLFHTICFFGVSTVLLLWGRVPVLFYLRLLQVPLLFILCSAVAMCVEIAPSSFGVLSVPVGVYYWNLTALAQQQALLILTRTAACIAALYALSLTTPIYKMIEVFQTLRLPEIVIELMYLIYRYIFVLLELHDSMEHSAASRLGYSNVRVSIKTATQHAANLLFFSLRRSSDYLAAMDSRCYNGKIQFYTRKTTTKRIEIILFIGYILALVLLAICLR